MFRSLLALGFGLSLVVGVAGDVSAQSLKLGGTGGALGFAQLMAEEYAGVTGTRIEVIPGLGSSGSIRAVADGAIDIAIASRPLKPEEAARGLSAVLFARTPMVFVTSHRSPPGVNSAELPALFAQTSPTWPDGSPLRIVLRPPTDTDVAIVEGYFAGLAEAFEVARRRPEVPVTSTDQENAEVVAGLPGSFAHAGLSQIVTEKPNLRVVPVDGVEPTLENLASGAYPYEKPFYLVYAESNADAVEALLAFLRSERGRALLIGAGNLPVSE